MKRFEIEDIAGQSDTGIVYRAVDTESGNTISIHRFFPFGQNNGGLDLDESAAFEGASKRLAEANHPALRSVIEGGTDPIDHIPFLAMEWVDRISLQTLLADEVLEPALVLDILRLALEVSITLSEILGDEALWVKTRPDSIVVGTQESDRGFTFCISPLKWLGAEPDRKSLLPLVELGEQLVGWKGRLVSDRSGLGLGGWFKQIKRHPETSLREACDSLKALAEAASLQSEEATLPYAIRPIARPKKRVSKRTLAAVALFAVSIPSSLLLYLHKTAKIPSVDLGYSEQKITNVVTTSNVRAESSRMEASTNHPDQTPTKIASNSTRTPASMTPEVPQPELQRSNAAMQASEKKVAVSSAQNHPDPTPVLLERKNTEGVYEAINEVTAKRMRSGLRVKLRGELSGVSMVNSSDSIFLDFSTAEGGDSIRGVIRAKQFEGDFSPETFEKHLGQVITLRGSIINLGSGKLPLVKIVKMTELTPEK